MTNAEVIQRFTENLKARMQDYGIQLSGETVGKLTDYYAVLLRWNERLHLVAPCKPEEFATRHLLESLLVVRFIAQGTSVIDVGSGAGLPIIPVLIARPDLKATLIESSQKKSVFLREALKQIGISAKASIITKPFEETKPPDASFVTCRALDQLLSKVATLINWAPPSSTLLLFGGEALREEIRRAGVTCTEFLIPFSARRFLFEVKKR